MSNKAAAQSRRPQIVEETTKDDDDDDDDDDELEVVVEKSMRGLRFCDVDDDDDERGDDDDENATTHSTAGFDKKNIQFAKREEEEEEEEEDHHHHLFVKSSSSLSGETSSTPQSSSLSQSSTRRKMNKKKKQRPTALDVSEQKLGTLLSTFTTAGQRRRTASTDELMHLETKLELAKACRFRASEVYEKNPVLYVGGDELVTKEEQLRRLKEELNVTRILCCYDADDATIRTTNGGGDFASSPASSTSASFERMSLPLIDTSEEDIACVLYDAFDFMLGNERREGRNDDDEEEEEEEEEEEKEEEKEGGSCLVHCQMGCSRSVAICVAFIMWKEGLSYDEAFERVKKARAISRPNIGFVKTLEAWHEARTNRSSSSSSGSDVISYRIVEHENRKGYVVPKRETPSSFAAANNTPFSPKDDPNAVVLRFKSEACDDVLPTLLVGDRVDRDTDPRVDKRALDKITEQILFYEYGVCKHARRRLRRRRR